MSMTLAGTASRTTTHVSPGEERTARTTSPRIAIPKTLKSARPTSLPSMKGYSTTAASWATNSVAEGSRRAKASTAP
jgi:hypothetical protein